MKYILAHDLGTSGNKATLFSEEGSLVASVTQHYPVYYSNGNWAEQDPNDWWNAVVESTQQLVTHVDPADIAAVSFSGQMMGCVCVDKAGTPLRNAIIWADMRATEQEAKIRQRIDENEFYHLTGHKISPSYGGQKLMWIKEHEPDIYARTYKMLNAKDYIILRLTGTFVTEYTDASSTCLMDLEKLEWSDRLLDAMQLNHKKMPQLCRSTDVAGKVTVEAAALTGLAVGTKVVCGGGDGVCAAVGTGCVQEGIAHSSMGTSSWISITSRKPVFDEKQRTFTWAHIVPGYVLPTGTMQTGGGAYAWYVDHFCYEEKQIAKNHGQSVYQILEELLAESQVGSNGLIFLPYLIGERSPRWNPNVRGCFVGIRMEHTQKDFLRAVQEGVAMNLNEVLKIFREAEQKIEEIIVVGGGIKSVAWQQILADVYQERIRIPKLLDEATSMGAAITGGVGVGLFADFSVVDKFVSIARDVHPNPDNAEKYDALQDAFEEAYQALVSVYEQLHRFCKS